MIPINRCFLSRLAMLLVAAVSAPRTKAAEPLPNQPNIVFIMADDLGYAELGCYGQKKIQTPNIDRLAAEGMRFTQCYAGSHVCAPSRSTLMTGLHTGHTPIRANGGYRYLYDEDITVAEILKQAEYVTGGFGKWGLGTEETPGFPLKQGFDEWFGFYHQVHAHFYYPYYLWHNGAKFFLPENEGRQRARYSHDEIHKYALEFIRAHKDQPFFCYLPYTLPHVELVVPEDSMKPYHGKWVETALPDPRPGYLGATEPYATHAGMVSRLDRSVGEVMALLKQLNLDENTIVFFSSDNGPQGNQWQRVADFFNANGPFRGYKGQFYEGGIREPLLVRWPGKIKAGSQSELICAFWDFLPTFAELAHADAPKPLDGISFVPTLLGQPGQKPHEFFYWEMGRGKNLTQAMRLGDWKALRHKADGRTELYNLALDIGERTNVAAEHPDIVEKVAHLMAREHADERDYPAEKGSHTPKDYVR
jgi:arylsulfatase A-like enzyme